MRQVYMAMIIVCSFIGFGAVFAEKLTISGYIGTSSMSAASKANVVLYLKDKEQPVDSVQTNFFGRGFGKYNRPISELYFGPP
jgi:hypothetical protein